MRRSLNHDLPIWGRFSIIDWKKLQANKGFTFQSNWLHLWKHNPTRMKKCDSDKNGYKICAKQVHCLIYNRLLQIFILYTPPGCILRMVFFILGTVVFEYCGGSIFECYRGSIVEVVKNLAIIKMVSCLDVNDRSRVSILHFFRCIRRMSSITKSDSLDSKNLPVS